MFLYSFNTPGQLLAGHRKKKKAASTSSHSLLTWATLTLHRAGRLTLWCALACLGTIADSARAYEFEEENKRQNPSLRVASTGSSRSTVILSEQASNDWTEIASSRGSTSAGSTSSRVVSLPRSLHLSAGSTSSEVVSLPSSLHSSEAAAPSEASSNQTSSYPMLNQALEQIYPPSDSGSSVHNWLQSVLPEPPEDAPIAHREIELRMPMIGEDGKVLGGGESSIASSERTASNSSSVGSSAGSFHSAESFVQQGTKRKRQASSSDSAATDSTASASFSVASDEEETASVSSSVSTQILAQPSQPASEPAPKNKVAEHREPTAMPLPQPNSFVEHTSQRLSKLDQQVSELHHQFKRQRRIANAGAAAAMAMPNFMPSEPGKSTLAVGAAHYEGESALAIGLTKRIDSLQSRKKAFNVAVSATTARSVGVRMQAAFEF